MNTIQLSNGLTILAKDSDPAQPLKYGNRTMADKKVASFGPYPYEWTLQVTASTAKGLSYGPEDDSRPLPAGFYVVVGMENPEREGVDPEAGGLGAEDADWKTDDDTANRMSDSAGDPAEARTMQDDLKYKTPFATISGPRENPRNRHNHRNPEQTDQPYTISSAS